jgi:hypothetical protein
LTFLNPLLLSSAAAILIPVFLHFFFKRKKKIVYFSSIRFLKELDKKQLIKSSWLEWILLALRILTIAFLVLAFAYPSGKERLFFSNHDEVNTFIFINHNEYLNIQEDKINLKEKLISKFRDFVRSENLEFLYWVSPYDYSITRISAQDLINRITELDYYSNKNEIKSIQSNIFEFTKANNMSDYRSILLTVEKFEELKNIELLSPKIDKNIRNIGIRSAYIKESIRSPETDLTLVLNTDRFQFDDKIDLLISINNKTFFNKMVDQSSDQLEIKLGKFSENLYRVSIKILNSDSYDKDNDYYLNFKINKTRDVLVLTKNENSILNRFFNDFPDSAINIVTDYSFNSLRYQFMDFNTVFLESPTLNQSNRQQISRYLNNGTFILFTDSNFDHLTWNKSELSKQIRFNRFEIKNFSIKERNISNFFLPEKLKNTKAIDPITVFKRWNINAPEWLELIGSKSNSILIEKDKFFVFLTGINDKESNLIYHPIMANILYQLIFGEIETAEYNSDNKQLVIKNSESITELDLNHSISEKKIRMSSINNSLGKSYFTLPKNMITGHYDYRIQNSNFVFSLNKEQIYFSNINFDGSENEYNGNLVAASNYYYWRFFIFLALISYILEFLIGQLAVKNYEK